MLALQSRSTWQQNLCSRRCFDLATIQLRKWEETSGQTRSPGSLTSRPESFHEGTLLQQAETHIGDIKLCSVGTVRTDLS